MNQRTNSRTLHLMIAALAVCAAFAVLPLMNGQAFADAGDPAMTIGAEALQKNMNTGNAASVFYGQNDGNQYWWRVIGYAGKGAASTDSSVSFLIEKDTTRLKIPFNEGYNNHYADSILKEKMDTIASTFTSGEQGAIEKKTLVSGQYQGDQTDCIAGPTVENALLWPLSSKEACQVDNDLRIIPPTFGEEDDVNKRYGNRWWLRSPGVNGGYVAFTHCTGQVEYTGDVPDPVSTWENKIVRPAFTLSLDSIVLTSSAKGGKPTGSEEKPLVDIGSNPTNEWKLTVKDQDHSRFKADLIYFDYKGTLRFEYSGASEQFNDFISAVITDKDHRVKAYGRIARSLPGDHIIEMTVPEQYTKDDYMYVFSEKINGDKETDYASALQGILYPNAWTQPSPMTVSGKTVRIKSKANKLNKTKKISAAKAYRFINDPVGEPAFQMVKASKSSGKFKVDPKTGRITVKKGLKRGTYQLTVKVKDPGNDTCSPAAANVVVKIKVVK